jgi:hypothetical protein
VSDSLQEGGPADGSPSDVSHLVKRDIKVFAGGSVAALLLFADLGLSAAGVVDKQWAAKLAVLVGALVGGGCVAWWLTGPRELRGARYIVLVPTSLVAGPVLIGLQQIGAGAAAVVLSSAFGFGAAIAAGLAWTSRRRT